MIVLETPEDVIAKLEEIGIKEDGRNMLREFAKKKGELYVDLPYAASVPGESWKQDQITLAETLRVPVSAL